MSRSKMDPPDISNDAVALSRIAVRYCRCPHPDVVGRLEGAVFPSIRASNKGGKRGERGKVDGRRIMYDDNTTPRLALLWSHGFGVTKHPAGWTFAHVWDVPKDPDAYTHIANLVMLPESLASLTDKQGPLVPYLRYHAETVYGWRPAGKATVRKPLGYDDLTWTYLDPIPDPPGFVRNRMKHSNDKRIGILHDLMGM